MEIKLEIKNLPVLFLNLLRRNVTWKLFLRCKNDVCVGALSVNFTMLYFMWFVSHFTVDVTRLLLSSRFSLLVINLLTTRANYCTLINEPTVKRETIMTTKWPNSDMQDKPHKIKHWEIYGQSADTNIVTDSFLHRAATSISLCFRVDSRTEHSTDKFLSLI